MIKDVTNTTYIEKKNTYFGDRENGTGSLLKVG